METVMFSVVENLDKSPKTSSEVELMETSYMGRSCRKYGPKTSSEVELMETRHDVVHIAFLDDA